MFGQKRSFTLLQASQANPGLAKLMAMQQDSNERLQAIRPLIPPLMQPGVSAGPIDDGVWCLIVANTTTAAKLRQLIPSFVSHLHTRGLPVTSIRLKVKRQNTEPYPAQA